MHLPLPRRLRELAESVSTMTLATTGADSFPYATPVYFASDECLNLYFFSEPTSLHSQHSAQNPQAAAAIYPPCQGWRDIRGLQLRGTVHLVESGECWDQAWNLYVAKFPFVRHLKAVVAKGHMYSFIPIWIRLVDNAQGFGYKEEFHIPSSQPS